MKTAFALVLLSLSAAPIWAAEPAPQPAPPPSGETAPTGPAPLTLALREAVAQALERNLDLAVARLQPPSNAQDVIAAEAVFDPSLGASAGYNYSKQEPTSDFSPTSSTNQTAELKYTDPLSFGGQYSVVLDYGDFSSKYGGVATRQFGLVADRSQATLTLNYQQSLLRNFGLEVNHATINEAVNTRHISENQLRQRIGEIVEQVESSYWTLVGAQKQLGVAQTALDWAKDFERQTRIKVDVGILAPIEITSAEAQVAAQEEGVIIAENAVRNGEDALRALLRVAEGSPDWDRPIQAADQPGFAPIQVDVERAINDALARRSEIAAAQLSIRNAELNEKYRRNQTKPDLSGTASYALIGNNFDYRPETSTSQELVPVQCTSNPAQICFVYQNVTTTSLAPAQQGRLEAFNEVPTGANYTWSVGALLTVPIRNRAAKAALVKASLAVEQSHLQFEALKQQIRVEVRTAARDLESASRRVATTRKNVELQNKKLDAEKKRYDNGLSTAFQVLTYQRDLRDAESQQINAIIDYTKALTHLARVQGVLLDERGVDVKM